MASLELWETQAGGWWVLSRPVFNYTWGVKWWASCWVPGARFESLSVSATGFGGVREGGNSVVARCALHSGLRQSGTGLRPGLYGTRERVPFRRLRRGEKRTGGSGRAYARRRHLRTEIWGTRQAEAPQV